MIGISQYKLSFSAVSLSVLLALSACSNDASTDDASAINNSTESAAITDETTSTEVAAIDSEASDDTTSQVQVDNAEVSANSSVSSEESAVDSAADTDVLAADAGAKLYESNCQVCHAAGLLDAPKYGDVAAWSARLSKDKETLYLHSVKGFNKMPAQAVDGVTEAQVKAAVDYMLASVS